MSVLDKLRKSELAEAQTELAEEASLADSASSTLVVVEPQIIVRLRGVLFALQTFMRDNDSGAIGRMSFLLSAFAEEVIDELAEKDELTMQIFMAQIGSVIGWIGHGNNDQLPDSIRPFAESIQPSVRNDD